MEIEPAIDRIGNPRKRAMLVVFSQTGNVVRSARAAKVPRSQHYYWLNTDPDYAAAFEEARRESLDILESEAIRRAVEGVEQYMIHAGEFVRDPDTGNPLIVRKYSDTLLKFLLEAAAPHKYRRNQPATDTGDDGVRIAGRGREQVIREEIANRQAALEALTRAKAREN